MKMYSIDYAGGRWSAGVVEVRASLTADVLERDPETGAPVLTPHHWFDVSILVKPHIRPDQLGAILARDLDQVVALHERARRTHPLPGTKPQRDEAERVQRLRDLLDLN